MKNFYLINEIYPCLQGEGINLGKPSLLVRLQICNLRCVWCDTPYTHTMKSDAIDKNNPKGPQKFFKLSLEELVQKIEGDSYRHIILTGGEPTLQNIGLLMRELHKKGAYTFEVESNGTKVPHEDVAGFLPSDYNLAQWNISPKFSNAQETLVDHALAHWAHLSAHKNQVYFKFVVREKFLSMDMEQILQIVEKYKIQNNNVVLMPEGTDINSQIKNIWLHDTCLKYGFRYTPRLHILLFGNMRGV